MKYCLLTPNLLLGGAELWARWLVEFCPVEWLGIGCRRWKDSPIVSASLPVPRVVGREQCRKLANRADVVVTWGRMDEFIDPQPGQKIVAVSHCCTPQRVAACATHLVAVSQPAAAAFGRECTILHNGADTRRLELTQPREQTRAEWGLKPGELAVGFVGRCSPEKRPEAAIQAAEALGWRAVLCGPNAERYPGCIAVPPTDKIGDVLHALDVFILASPSEGFSLAMIEAMLCGTPCVCTPVGAVPELEAVHGPLVCRVPVGASAEQLAAAVRQAVSPENRETVQRARETAWRLWTAERMGERWQSFLQRI